MAITTILTPSTINFSKNFIPVKFQSDSFLDGFGNEKENYRIYVELWVENATHTDFELINTQNLPLVFGSAGQAETDLKDTLHAILEDAGPDYMDVADTSFLQVKKSVRKFYLKYAESVDGVVGALTQSANFTVAYGGLSYQSAFSSNLLLAIQPDAADATKDRFLRQGNGTQYTRSNQPQFLYFLNSRATINANLKARFYFTNNSTLDLTLCNGSLTTLEKFAFNVKFDAIITEVEIVGRTCQKYEVWLETVAVSPATPVRLSEIRTFFLDFQLKEYVRYFTYWSSWGAVNTLLTYGKASSKIEIIQSEAQRIRKSGDDIKKGDRLNFDITLNNDFSCATGFVSRRELGFNRDFYLSPFKFRYTGGKLLPISVTSKNINEVNDGNGLFAQNFDYKYLFDDDCYTEGDLEDGVGIDGFFFNLNPANPTQGFNETDPTVPSWVKSISLTDIANWNAGAGAGGTANWGQISGVITNQTDLINYLNINYKPIGYSPSNTEVLSALGFTPYNSSNPAGYITGINSAMVTGALGYTPYDASNPSGFVNAASGAFIKNQDNLQSDSKFYVDKGTFENTLNIPHDLGVNRKVSFKFKNVAGTGGTPPPAGAQYLYNLLDVNIPTPLNGQALVFQNGFWVNQNIVTDLSNYFTKPEINNILNGITAAVGYNKTNWDTAFSWGNHALAGYAFANGSNASGTWGINISGNANSASNSILWNGWERNYSAEGSSLAYLFGGDGLTSVQRFYTAPTIRTFLGMPAGGDTLQSVAARGNTFTGNIAIDGFMSVKGNISLRDIPYANSNYITFGDTGTQYAFIGRAGNSPNLTISADFGTTNIIGGNVQVGYTVNQGYKLAVNGTGFFSGAVTASGGFTGNLNGAIVLPQQQTVYTILTGVANGPVIKVRYDGGTANRYIQIGYKDGNEDYYQGLQIFNGTELSFTGTSTFSGTVSSSGLFDNGSRVLSQRGQTYYQVDTWLQINGSHGLYAPSVNGQAHFYPNNASSYGAWATLGHRNFYSGIYDGYSGVTYGMYDGGGNGGAYREANGAWHFYFNVSNGCLALGSAATTAGWNAQTVNMLVTNKLGIPHNLGANRKVTLKFVG